MTVPHSPRRPRVIPVLDLLNGVVVRAVGGRRSEYRPVESTLTRSTAPLDVAKALLDASGANELYVADLDEILRQGSNLLTVRRMVEELPVTVWVDFGFRTMADAAKIPKDWLPGVRPVIGSETVLEPWEAWDAAQFFQLGAAFSIDLRNGLLLDGWEKWREMGVSDPAGVVPLADNIPTRTFLVLDLAAVGENAGPVVEPHLRAIREALPNVELIAGGGVRGVEDVDRLGAAGADAVLVASALHAGRMGRAP